MCGPRGLDHYQLLALQPCIIPDARGGCAGFLGPADLDAAMLAAAPESDSSQDGGDDVHSGDDKDEKVEIEEGLEGRCASHHDVS